MNKFSFTGIGLIFGTAIGSLVVILMSLDFMWALVGTSSGLLVGAVIDANKKGTNRFNND